MPSTARLVRHALVTLPLLLSGFGIAGAEPNDESGLTREQEIAAALAAGPPNIRAEAGVYVLGAQGFARVRESRNGFHCLIGRSVPGSFEPMCFDAEGSATLLEQMLLRARLRAQGLDDDAVADRVAEAWSAGELRPPRRSGINYMLSTENRVPVDAAGNVRPYRPHVMIYVPYLTNEDLGAGQGSPVFVINEGGPGAYLIVPVPSPDDQ